MTPKLSTFETMAEFVPTDTESSAYVTVSSAVG